MIIKVKREKPKMRWLYFVHVEGRTVVKMQTDAPESVAHFPAYRRCSYREYLRVRSMIRARERKLL